MNKLLSAFILLTLLAWSREEPIPMPEVMFTSDSTAVGGDATIFSAWLNAWHHALNTGYGKSSQAKHSLIPSDKAGRAMAKDKQQEQVLTASIDIAVDAHLAAIAGFIGEDSLQVNPVVPPVASLQWQMPAGAFTNNTSSYDAFGNFLQLNDTNLIAYYYRRGFSHVGGKGDIWRQVYNKQTATWATPEAVWSHATLDTRSCIMQNINGTYFMFTSLYNTSTGLHEEGGFLTSTDGLTFGSYTKLWDSAILGLPNFNAYGKVSKLSTEGGWMMNVFAHAKLTTTLLTSFITNDHGQTWSKGPDIYHGYGQQVGEMTCANVGGSNLLAMGRNFKTNEYIAFLSEDDGQTWSAPLNTQLAATLSSDTASTDIGCIGQLYYNSKMNKIVLAFHNRPERNTYMTETTPERLATDITDWDELEVLDTDYFRNGYPDIHPINDTDHLVVWAREPQAGDSDIRYTTHRVRQARIAPVSTLTFLQDNKQSPADSLQNKNLVALKRE